MSGTAARVTTLFGSDPIPAAHAAWGCGVSPGAHLRDHDHADAVRAESRPARSRNPLSRDASGVPRTRDPTGARVFGSVAPARTHPRRSRNTQRGRAATSITCDDRPARTR